MTVKALEIAIQQFFSGSYRWTDEHTQKIVDDFKDWINVEKGNSLPSLYLFFFSYSIDKFI